MFLASPMPAKVAEIFVITLKFLVADEALCFMRISDLSGFEKIKNFIWQLEFEHFIFKGHHIVIIAHEIFLDFNCMTVLIISNGEKLTLLIGATWGAFRVSFRHKLISQLARPQLTLCISTLYDGVEHFFVTLIMWDGHGATSHHWTQRVAMRSPLPVRGFSKQIIDSWCHLS